MKTGTAIWDVELANYKHGYSITVAPLVVKDNPDREFPSYDAHRYMHETQLGREDLAKHDADTRQKHYDRIAMKRWGEIAEIAEGAVFLCSDAARYVTGTILDIDGGSQLGDATQRSVERGLA